MKEEVYTAGQLFGAGSMPNITYVDRANHSLEKKMRAHLDLHASKALLVTGPSKSGKTVLTKKVLQNDTHIFFDCSTLKNEDSIWEHFCREFSLVTSVENTLHSEEAYSAATGLSLKAEVLEVGNTLNSARKLQEGQRFSTLYERKTIALDYLRKHNSIVLVFDDFHHLEHATQNALVSTFKPLLFEKIRIIVITLTNNHRLIININPDMVGRVRELKIPFWTYAELEEIPVQGFKKLKCSPSEFLLRSIVRESYYNPYITQELCLAYCEKYSILRTEPTKKHIDLPKAEYAQFFSTVFNGGLDPYAYYSRITKAIKQRGKKRSAYTLRTSILTVALDIYYLILHFLVNADLTKSYATEDLFHWVSKLKITSSTKPSYSQCKQALIRLARAAKPLDSEPKVEPAFVFRDNELTVLEPFFIYYLRWKLNLQPLTAA